MASINEIIKGLQIFSHYVEDPNDLNTVETLHEKITVYDVGAMTDEHIKELEEMGWNWDTEEEYWFLFT